MNNSILKKIAKALRLSREQTDSNHIAALNSEIEYLKGQLNLAKLCGLPTENDRALYASPTRGMNLWTWLPTFANREDFTILEIGSREVANKSRLKECLPRAKHIGFDIHKGANVDLVGDAHRLSDYVLPNSINVIISFAVFEHLAMPWIVAEEYSKVLKIGGVAGTFTHFSFGEHELPWHFFQFNNRGLEVLFNNHLGFETIESGKGMPMVGRFSYDCSPEQAGRPIPNLYCSSYLVTKKIADRPLDFCWLSCLDSAYKQTMYPKNTGIY